MSDPTAELEVFLAGLAGRVKDIALVLHRLDRLEAGDGRWLGEFVADQSVRFDAAQEVLLRAFGVVSDRINWAILQELAAHETCPLGRLAGATGLGRFALVERLNDLVQVGLASRLLDTDSAQVTPAGLALYRLVSYCSQEVSARAADLLGRFLGQTVRPPS